MKLHKDEPFALIGINVNDSEEAFRDGVEKFEVTWISAFEGKGDAPIAKTYQVRGFPTYVLIDAEGKIVEMGHSGTAMDEPIQRLLAAMK